MNQYQPPGNILPPNPQQFQGAPPPPQVKLPPKKESKYSPLSIFLAVIFLGVIIMLGERLIFDLNRFINPVVDKEYTDWQNKYYKGGGYSSSLESIQAPQRSMDMLSETSNLAGSTKIYYKSNEKGRYFMYRLIIHATVILPLFILAFALFYFKKDEHKYRPVLFSFLIFAFWMMFHLLGETIKLVMDEYKNLAIYIILILLAAIMGGLAYYTQTKHKVKGTGASNE